MSTPAPQPPSPHLQATASNHDVNVLGVRIDRLTAALVLDIIDAAIDARQRVRMLTVNVRALDLAYQHAWLRSFFNASEYVLCDGFGVKLAARLLGQSLPERFTPPDWLPAVAGLAARRGHSIYFLGNQPGVADEAARRLVARFPSLCVAGVHHGHFDLSSGSAENERVIQHINSLKPNILYVGFGMPLQERWLMDNWDRLDVNVAITVGAMLDFIAGARPRAPRWLTDRGLEWLTRLAIEPRRLWRRYLIGLPVFLWRVLLQRAGRLRFP